MVSLKGILPPMVTPFTSDNRQDVDEVALRDLTSFLIDEGVNGLIPTAGAGEYVYLSFEEWKRVNEVVIDEANGRVPVVTGILDPGTRNVINRAKVAKDLGADAIMVLIHQYYFPSDEEVFEHFEKIATQSELPVMLYNLTRMSGKDINPAVVARLVEGGHIVSIKESTRDFLHTTKLLQICGDKVTVLKGYAEDFLPALCIGIKGTVTTGSNCFAGILASIWDSFHKGEYEKAERLHYSLMPIIDLTRRRNDVKIAKAALALMGHPVGPPRTPLTPATEEDRKELKGILSGIGLI